MSGLSKRASQAVVNELTEALGNSSAAQAIGITSGRLKSLSVGATQLSDLEMEQIYIATQKTWRTWLLDAIRRSGASDDILGPTTELVNSLNGAEMDAATKPRVSKRARPTRVV